LPIRTLTKKEREAIQAETRMGRLFGVPLKDWTSGKSCLSCGVALLWIKWKGAPRYCLDCAEELGVDQRAEVRDDK
jgi:hypothetical protein